MILAAASGLVVNIEVFWSFIRPDRPIHIGPCILYIAIRVVAPIAGDYRGRVLSSFTYSSRNFRSSSVSMPSC